LVSSTPVQPTPGRSPRAERTRQRILDAAGQCFAASGYAKTTVEEVASRAGVSKGLVHHHFGTKARILEAVLERTLAKWDALSQVETLTSGGSVRAGIAEMHRASVAYARENPALHALLELDGRVLLDAGFGREVRSVMQRLRAALADTLRIGIESGELREDLDAEHAADVVLVHHLAYLQHVIDPEWVDVSDDALIEAGLDILLRGLARNP
jgi:AcrR family transcriptional regulator